MKQVFTDKVIQEEKWLATDGTEFSCREECKKYEESARGVLRGRFFELVVSKDDAWELLRGCDDHSVYSVKLSSQEDINTLLQLYYIENPHLQQDPKTYQKYIDRYEKLTNQAFREHDLLLMGMNCDDELYFIDTRNNIVNRLNELGKEKEDDTKGKVG